MSVASDAESKVTVTCRNRTGGSCQSTTDRVSQNDSYPKPNATQPRTRVVPVLFRETPSTGSPINIFVQPFTPSCTYLQIWERKNKWKPFTGPYYVFFSSDIKSVHFCGLLKRLWSSWAACPPLAEPFLLPWPREQCIRLRRHCFLGVLMQRAQRPSWRGS